MSDYAKEVLHEVDELFTPPESMHIRVFGLWKPPHHLPLFMIDKIILQEIACQMAIGVNGMLT